MDQESLLMASRLRPICVNSCSLAAKSETGEAEIEYEKNEPVVSIYPQI